MKCASPIGLFSRKWMSFVVSTTQSISYVYYPTGYMYVSVTLCTWYINTCSSASKKWQPVQN